MNIFDRLLHTWNAFHGVSASSPMQREPTVYQSRKKFMKPTAANFAAGIYNRIALDVALTSFEHVKIDAVTDDIEPMKSKLYDCLNVEANIDQGPRAFFHDVVFSLFDEGAVAIVPVETSINPSITAGYDIEKLRVGKILEFKTKSVIVLVYDEESGLEKELLLPKADVCIIENPLYSVMNGPNSTLQRLLHKINLIDNFDEVVASGKLDVLIQLPYSIKTTRQQAMADGRLNAIEANLKKGNHGIAYIDTTEKVIQLNRPSNNKLLDNIKLLTDEFYNQLGLTKSIFDGTATGSELLNYFSRTIDPIIDFILDEMNRKFLTKTARTQGQKIIATRNYFKFIPVDKIIELGDTFRRNQILTSNEIRKLVGFKASDDPIADELANPNISQQNQMGGPSPTIDELAPEPELEPQSEEPINDLPRE